MQISSAFYKGPTFGPCHIRNCSMARNEEKHAGRLNRLWLQQLDEEKEKKNPQRPGLGSLNSASEIKKWIPSIKTDIDFYLKQSQVTCYPERQITDFSTKIENLTKEYKAYVRKLREFQPGDKTVPWTDRAYNRKHKINSPESEDGEDTDITNKVTDKTKKSRVEFTPLNTPVLDTDKGYSQMYGYQDNTEPLTINLQCTELQNQPLNFNWKKEMEDEHPVDDDTRGLTDNVDNVKDKAYDSRDDSQCNSLQHTERNKNVLNLPYSDSSDEDG